MFHPIFFSISNLSSKNSSMLHVHPNISSFYMWFSFGITVLELISSIHFNLSNLKNLFTCDYHPKFSLMFNFHPNFSSIWDFHPCTCGKIFSTSFLWHRDILRILYSCHKNIPNIFIPTHKLMFIGSCSCSHACFVMLLPE